MLVTCTHCSKEFDREPWKVAYNRKHGQDIYCDTRCASSGRRKDPSPLDVFGSLTVVRFSHYDAEGKRFWVCRCKCGGERVVPTSQLRIGDITQCKACAEKAGRERLYYWIKRTDARSKATRQRYNPRTPSVVCQHCSTKTTGDEILDSGFRCPNCGQPVYGGGK